jgi:hypothetical protein
MEIRFDNNISRDELDALLRTLRGECRRSGRVPIALAFRTPDGVFNFLSRNAEPLVEEIYAALRVLEVSTNKAE